MDRWRRIGQPQLEKFLAEPGPATNPEQVCLDGLPDQLRVEIALALQLAAADGTQHLNPYRVRRLVVCLRQHQPASLLGVLPDSLQAELEEPRTSNQKIRAALRSTCTTLEQVLHPPRADETSGACR